MYAVSAGVRNVELGVAVGPSGRRVGRLSIRACPADSSWASVLAATLADGAGAVESSRVEPVSLTGWEGARGRVLTLFRHGHWDSAPPPAWEGPTAESRAAVDVLRCRCSGGPLLHIQYIHSIHMHTDSHGPLYDCILSRF